MPRVVLRAVLVWLIIIGVETVHGVLRTLLLVPLLGDFPARRVSVFTGSLLNFGVAWVFVRWIGGARDSGCSASVAVGVADGPVRDRPGPVRPRPVVGPHRRGL